MDTINHKVPPLEPGDVLTRPEFLRRWEHHPEIKKAELIRGIVYMPSPVKIIHGTTDNHVGHWLGHYVIHTPGTDAIDNATSFMLDDAPQPDNLLRILSEAGGKSWIEGGYLHGAAELTAEVCASRTSYDLHQKLELYQETGVQEYLTVLTEQNQIRWHQLVKGRYRLLHCSRTGIWRSEVFPGLWLNGPALLAGNMAEVLHTLDDGLQSKEHQDFVARLHRKMKTAQKKA